MTGRSRNAAAATDMGVVGANLVKFNTAVHESKEIFKEQKIISVNATPVLGSTE